MTFRITFRDGNQDQLFDNEAVSIDYHNRIIVVDEKRKHCVPVIYPFENISYWRLEGAP